VEGALGALWFDDLGDKPAAEFQQEWHELLRMSNLFQFIPRFLVISRRMVDQGMIANYTSWLLEHEGEEAQPQDKSAFTEEQSDELQMLHSSLQSRLIPLLAAGSVPWPEFAYEFIDEAGRCGTCMLEVAWPSEKIGIVLPDHDASDFEKAGWQILHADHFDSATFSNIFSSHQSTP
jgi:hypothetical protein